MTTTAILTRDDQHLTCANLIATAKRLNEAKRNHNFSAFREICLTSGLSATVTYKTATGGPDETCDEPQFYWDRLCTDMAGTIESAKSNRALARAMGIEVSNAHTAAASLLYRLTECAFPDIFDVELCHRPHESAKESRGLPSRVTMYHAANGSARHSWASHLFLLFHGHNVEAIINRHVRERSKHLYDLMGDNGYRLGQLLYEQRMLIPDATMANLLSSVLKRGQSGETIHILGAFCPDYAYEATGDPNLPYRYTFDGLNTGVGLVAQQFLRVTRPISQFLTSLGIRHEFVYGIGDFEADSIDIQRRVLGREDYDEFVRRCSCSLDAFREKIGADIPVTLELCDAHRCKGRLRPYAKAATEQMVSGDFGRIGELFPNPEKVIAQIVRENGGFYRRWFSPDMGDDKIRELVLLQGGEYAALARIYAEDFKESNIIVLSGDRPLMHTFDALHTVTPILCVKRAY